MKFDELNRLREYFNGMYISDEDKEKRVLLGRQFYNALSYVLALMWTDSLLNEDLDRDFYIRIMLGHLTDILEDEDIFYDGSLRSLVESVIDTTIEHYGEEEYFDDERALNIAQDASNTVYNAAEYNEALEAGMEYKTWIAEVDGRTRLWHLEVNGLKIPIDEYFSVGGERMRFPMDSENATAKNLAYCRCTVHYE